MRVLVVGAGIGGLTVGTALAQRDVDVEIIELKSAGISLGVGLVLPANALRALREVGVLETAWVRVFSSTGTGSVIPTAGFSSKCQASSVAMTVCPRWRYLVRIFSKCWRMPRRRQACASRSEPRSPP